jgi:predicted membrane protein
MFAFGFKGIRTHVVKNSIASENAGNRRSRTSQRISVRDSPCTLEEQMNKVLLGLLVGAVLGAIDGGTAWFTPAVRPTIVGIIFGSTIKGIIAGVAAGIFARKVNSLGLGILFGLAVGFVLAFLVAYLQHGYYFEIILPGSIVGALVGWATQRYGSPATVTASAR